MGYYSVVRSIHCAINIPLFAINDLLFVTENNGDVEHGAWVNATVEAIDFLKKHPEYMNNYNVWKDWVMKNIMEVNDPG